MCPFNWAGEVAAGGGGGLTGFSNLKSADQIFHFSTLCLPAVVGLHKGQADRLKILIGNVLDERVISIG